MAHKLYFDNVATRDATLTDGKIVNSNPGVFSFSSSGTITNENRAIDLDLTATISSFGAAIHPELGYSNNDALQFDFSSAKTIDFMAIYFLNQETDNLRIHADDAVSGNTAVQYAFTSTFSVGWNILSFTKASYQYWLLEATSGFLSPTEIFFGEAFILPIDGNSITTSKPFNSFIGSSYNNIEYSNKVDNELQEWSIQLPIITQTNKTSLELLQEKYSNLHTFVYYDDNAYHTVRLAKPIIFNQKAINVFSICDELIIT